VVQRTEREIADLMEALRVRMKNPSEEELGRIRGHFEQTILQPLRWPQANGSRGEVWFDAEQGVRVISEEKNDRWARSGKAMSGTGSALLTSHRLFRGPAAVEFWPEEQRAQLSWYPRPCPPVLVRALSDLLTAGEIQEVGHDTIQGRPCRVLELELTSEYTTRSGFFTFCPASQRVKLWLDEERACLLQFEEYGRPGGSVRVKTVEAPAQFFAASTGQEPLLLSTVTFRELVEPIPGCWLPQVLERQAYWYDGEGHRYPASLTTTRIEVVAVNAGIPAGQLDLELPVGTSVTIVENGTVVLLSEATAARRLVEDPEGWQAEQLRTEEDSDEGKDSETK